MNIKEKAWNLTLCLFSISRFRNDPTNKNKQVTPTPNMKCHQTEQSTRGCSAAGYTYPNGRLLPSCFGLVKFSGFRYAKTSANKRFLNMSSLFYVGERRYIYSQSKWVMLILCSSFRTHAFKILP